MNLLRTLCTAAALLLADPLLAEPEVDALRETMAAITEGEPRIEGEPISSVVLLPALYARHEFRPFWQRPEITITPHISARTLREATLEQITGKIQAHYNGQPISGIVDPSRGY